MVDVFGRCQECGQHTTSSGGCLMCNSHRIYISPGYIYVNGGFVWDSGWSGAAHLLPDRYKHGGDGSLVEQMVNNADFVARVDRGWRDADAGRVRTLEDVRRKLD